MPIAAAEPERLLLSIVSPCFNEEDVVERFHGELDAVLRTLPEFGCEIVLVDDGSTDRTLERLDNLAARDPRVRPVALSRNFGHQAALSAGLDAARGDLVVMMDADLQHPPALLPELIAGWRRGHDIVSTIRRTVAAPWLQRAGAHAFYRVINRLSDVPVQPAAADFCLITRRVCDELVGMRERHRMLRGLISWVGFSRTFIEFDAPARAAGRTKFTWRRRFGLAIDGILGFSTAPMRLAVWVGLVVATFGALYLLYVLAMALWYGDVVTGWPSLISVSLILGGLQIVFIGVIGAYLGRVFEQSKGRPLYVLRRALDARPDDRRGATARNGGER